MSYYRGISIGIGGPQQNIKLGVNKRVPDVTLQVRSGESGAYCKMIVKTKEEWDAVPTFVPGKHDFVVYSDYYENPDGSFCPRIKIGDGTTYVVDLPWTDGHIENEVTEILQRFEDHVNDMSIHVSQEDRDFWNNKLNYEVVEGSEMLILNRN